jgi:hypothetical protein
VTNRARQSKKIAEWSKKDLEFAKEWARTGSTPKAKREARRMARAAKRRRSKSNRRAARADCGDWRDIMKVNEEQSF